MGDEVALHSESGITSAQSRRCNGCTAELSGKGKIGPFGFRVLNCENCGKRTYVGLTLFNRFFYWSVFLLAITGVLALLYESYWAAIAGAGFASAIILIADSRMRSKVLAPIVVAGGLATSMTLAATAAVFLAGFGNAYSYEVVAAEGGIYQEFQAINFREGEQICQNGDDYYNCIEMHRAMYNSVCVSGPTWFSSESSLSTSARKDCDLLLEWVKEGQDRIRSCGYGCTVRADGDGRWGWKYLQPHVSTRELILDPVVVEEFCWWQLGDYYIGNCSE